MGAARPRLAKVRIRGNRAPVGALRGDLTRRRSRPPLRPQRFPALRRPAGRAEALLAPAQRRRCPTDLDDLRRADRRALPRRTQHGLAVITREPGLGIDLGRVPLRRAAHLVHLPDEPRQRLPHPLSRNAHGGRTRRTSRPGYPAADTGSEHDTRWAVLIIGCRRHRLPTQLGWANRNSRRVRRHLPHRLRGTWVTTRGDASAPATTPMRRERASHDSADGRIADVRSDAPCRRRILAKA
jgi:hypothetical protein